MHGAIFVEVVADIVGAENATLYASKFGALDEEGYTNGIRGYEALAFYVYTTALTWHSHINQELWSGRPSNAVAKFAAVLDGALRKLPAYTLRGGWSIGGTTTATLSAFKHISGGYDCLVSRIHQRSVQGRNGVRR